MDLARIAFFEKQEGQLCAQHALNALLQGPYFTAVDLSQLAMELDQQEASAMAEGGMDSAEYQRFMQAGSSNFDDSGFFSVQVISRALAVWNLDIRPIRSRDSAAALADPSSQDAFICNLDQHWFTLRRFGGSPNRWYNLNSTLNEPQYVSDTYLGMLITQLEAEGYSIFVVVGNIPPSEADLFAVEVPRPPPEALPTTARSATKQSDTEKDKAKTTPFSGKGNVLGGPVVEDANGAAVGTPSELTDDEMLARALAMSMGSSTPSDAAGMPPRQPSSDELQRAMAASLAEYDQNDKTLRRTLEMSMADSGVPRPQVQQNARVEQPAMSDAELMRRKRLERFGAK
ncbi:Josephin-domain-containing protein [Entophlyctis helioformis]|nr:Josephin-domain-containing protein [Entophlyctis helioformis]